MVDEDLMDPIKVPTCSVRSINMLMNMKTSVDYFFHVRITVMGIKQF